MRSPYAVLGVKKSAEPATIKSAYRTLAKSWHPDQNRTNPEASNKFAEITRAYQLLINPDLRQRFDRGDIDIEGRRRAQTTRNDANEIFSVFREALRRRPTAGKSAPKPGAEEGLADFDAMVKHIFGEDADTATCGTASATETDPLSALDDLFAKWKTIHRPKPVQPEKPARMPHLHATVEIDLEAVNSGTRVRIQTENGSEIELAIPPGMADGAQLRVEENLAAGNQLVTVTVRYRRHQTFRVEGLNLHLDAAIGLDEAILGGNVIVQGIDGPVRLAIPEWTTGHQAIIVSQRGLMGETGNRGDLHVHMAIRLPTKTDTAMVEFIRSRRKSLYI